MRVVLPLAFTMTVAALVACGEAATLNPQPAPPESPPRDTSRDHEPTHEELEQQQIALNTTDLALAMEATTTEPDRATVVFTITNVGPNPADQGQIDFTIPAGVGLVSIDVSCAPGFAPERTCFSNQSINTGKQRVMTAVFGRDGDAGAGEITLSARTANGEFPDPNATNNAATVTWSWTSP